jgi:hypothetical protein
MIEASGRYWKVQAEESFGCKINEQLSAYRLYENFLREKSEHPTKDAFINYIANKQKNRMENSKDTLPENIKYIVETVISDYSTAMGAPPLSAQAFIEKVDESKHISKRFKLDDSDLRMFQHILAETKREPNDEVIAEAKETFYTRSLTLSNGENKIYKDRKTFDAEFEGVLEKYQKSHSAKEITIPGQFFSQNNSSAARNRQPANNLSYNFK